MKKSIRTKGVSFLFLALISGFVIFSFFQLLRADTSPQSVIIYGLIDTGKVQLFSKTVSGALQAHQTFLAATNQYDSTADNPQRIKLHAYLALTRLAAVIIRNDGQGADTLRKLLAQYGINFTGDSTEDIKAQLPVNAQDKPLLPATAPSGEAIRAFLAGPFLTAINASIADMDLVISLLGTTESKEIIAKLLLDPQSQDPTLQDVEVDDGDYYLLRTGMKAMKGFILTWTAYNQDFNVRELTALLNSEMFNIQKFLDRHPDLLKVRTGNGSAALAEAKQSFIGAIDDYLIASDKTRNDANLQAGATELFTIGDREWQGEASLRKNLAKLRTSLVDPAQSVLQLVERNEDWNIQAIQGGNPKPLTAHFGDDFSWGNYSALDSAFGYGANLDYAFVKGTQIFMRFTTFYNGWVEFTGTLTNNNTQMTGTYNSWNPMNSNFSGTFTATRTSATDVLGERMNLNPIFGDGSTTLNLRDLLPQFSTSGFGQPITGTMGHGLNDDPTLGGILPDYTKTAWGNDPFQPTGVFTIPTAAITVDGTVSDWSGLSPILEDVLGETDPGRDITRLYLAKDSSYLYFRIDLAGSPSNYGEYQLSFKKQPGDQYDTIGDLQLRLLYQPGLANKWQLFRKSYKGNNIWSQSSDLNLDTFSVRGNGPYIEGRILLSNPADTSKQIGEIGGRYIGVTTTDGWWQTDRNYTSIQIAPASSVTGTLNVPNYSGTGPIYIQAYRYNSSFNPDPKNRLGGQVIFSGGYTAGMTYAVNNLPVGERIFLFVHWDKDMNGIVSPGDYTNFYQPLTTVAGNSSLNLATADAHSAFQPPEFTWAGLYSVKNVTGSTSVLPGVLISGPSPEDITVTMQGPGGLFSLPPIKYIQGKGLIYGTSTNYLPDGDYTFEAVDSLGRRATPVTYTYVYNGTLPAVNTTTMTPVNRTFAGTTTPTLSWQAPAGTGPYYYRVLIEDLSGYDYWLFSDYQTATSLTIPPGALQPNTPYRWFVRVYDSADHPMNCTQTNNLLLHTGTAQTPAIGSVNLRTRPPAGTQQNYNTSIEVYNLSGVFPDEVTAIRLKNASSGATIASSNATSNPISLTYRFFDSVYYSIGYSSTTPPAAGDYSLEVDIKRFGQTTVQTITFTPIPYTYHPVLPVDITSLAPSDNYYFDSPTPSFSWSPVTDLNTYYRLLIRDPLNNWPIWISAWTKNTTVSVPAGKLIPGGSYYWRVQSSSDYDPFQNATTGRYDSYANMNTDGNATIFRFTINKIQTALRGDLNDDGRVDMLDAVIVMQILTGGQPGMLRPNYLISGVDVAGDGKVGADDMIYILQWVSGLR